LVIFFHAWNLGHHFFTDPSTVSHGNAMRAPACDGMFLLIPLGMSMTATASTIYSPSTRPSTSGCLFGICSTSFESSHLGWDYSWWVVAKV